MSLYPGGLKSGINFTLEPECAYIRVGLYPGGPLFGILRYVNTVGTRLRKQSNVWNKTFENKLIVKDHRVQKTLTE